jgi:formylglycine-generating enzyme required for sulfatase activity
MGPVQISSLAPFFLARHELTQGQWARLWVGEPALRYPSMHGAGSNLTGVTDLELPNITLANPVEQVDWSMGNLVLGKHGLRLPTEAEWEYGCRAGSTTPWSCKHAELAHCANLSDETARITGTEWQVFEGWTDGYVVHARVGSLSPNAFGLHDMHGNVWEWCSDDFSGYTGEVGERVRGGMCRGICGGGYDSSAAQARSAFRRNPFLSLRSPDLGLRAARALQP